MQPTSRFGTALVAITCAVLVCGCTVAASPTKDGTGWTITRLDLEVRVLNEELTFSVGGTLHARLDAARSFGPSFRVNSQQSGIRWLALDAPGAKEIELNDPSGSAILAHARFAKPFKEGDELEVTFELEMEEPASQMMSTKSFAMASWIHAWYPHAKQSGNSFTARTMSVPGTTTLRLPAGWIALSDGKLIRRDSSDHETVEVWDLGANPVARSFAAGTYRAAEREIDGRTIRIYLFGKHAIGVDRLADLLKQTMTALEARLGRFPFDGYGVVEAPNFVHDWAAASQQTFILARSDNFKFEHGNVPLWAHEMCHAWWGNTVGTRGPGSKMAGEALAQLGVLIALDAIEGRDAVIEFLDFSRSGYSPLQSAKGYYGLVDDGLDHPLARLGGSSLSGEQTHNLADSKGMWVYYMLWQRLGDERFFGTLRELIAGYAGRKMSLDDIRRAFVAAAPEQNLEVFFAQWLDRTGGIDIDATVTSGDGSVELVLTQAEHDKPFRFDLDVDLKLADGTIRRERVEVRDRETRVSFEVPGHVVGADLDPDRRLLMRRPAYGAMPDIEGIAENATWLDPEPYLGDYTHEGVTLTVDDDHGVLWARTPNGSMRLWPSVDSPHRFRGTHGWVTFVLEDGRAETIEYKIDDGMTLQAVRTK